MNFSFFNSSSINTRIILGAIIVVSGFMLLTGYTLSKTFYNSAHSALEERLTGQIYLLMADRKLNPSDLAESPQEMSADLIHTAYSSGVSGYITQADGSILWQSGFSKEAIIPPVPVANQEEIAHGKKIFQQYEVNGEAYISLSIAIFWDLQNRKFPLIYHISDDMNDLNQQVADYQHSLWSLLILMSLTLLTTLILILRWGLKPLREVEQEIKAVEQGKQDLLKKNYPDELTPLTQNINQLIEYEHQQQLRYRNALGDLAHSLKTPLAIIKGQDFNKDKPAAYLDSVNNAIQRMNSIVEYQLQRAATASPSSHIQYLQLTPVVQTLIGSMKKIYQDKSIEFKLEITPDIKFKIDEGDFMEILGNLLDNACKWCQNQVSLSITCDKTELQIIISDNGSGIASDMINEITKRGVRADQFTPGHGVGLAIVQDIVSVYGGSIRFSPAEAGGLEVKIHFQL